MAACSALPTSDSASTSEAAAAAPKSDPQTREARTARLKAVARTGDAINALMKVGAPLDAVRAFARTTPEVVLEESPGEAVCKLAGDVTWHITTDAKGTILGFAFSGYEALGTKLGVDFAGNESRWDN